MRFILVILALSLVIIAIGNSFVMVLPSYFYRTLTLVLLGTVGIYFYLVEVKKERFNYFIQLYILTILIKLLAYGAYALIIVWDDPNGARMNALFFMVVYLIFTAVEVYFLYRKVNG